MIIIYETTFMNYNRNLVMIMYSCYLINMIIISRIDSSPVQAVDD